jgi:hypothetical protein
MSTDDDFAHRELCPDDACIGVLDPEGRCRVCGTVSSTALRDPRLRGLALSDEVPVPVDRSPAVGTLPPEVPESLEVDDDDFDRRRLCPDGGCVGLLGADGRCKVCGASATATPG